MSTTETSQRVISKPRAKKYKDNSSYKGDEKFSRDVSVLTCEKQKFFLKQNSLTNNKARW